MKVLGFVWMACVTFCLSAGEDKKPTNAEKIVGKWEITKAAEGAPVGATIEFQKDGKLKVSLKVQEMEITLMGTYKVDGDKVSLTLKAPDGKEITDSNTIKTLNDTTLILIEKNKKETEFKKKK